MTRGAEDIPIRIVSQGPELLLKGHALALPRTASAYLLFGLDDTSSVPSRRVTGLTPGGSYEAVSKTLRELDACLVAASHG